MRNCSNCPYGPHYDALSDYCDGCTHDSDTGWGGFTDHSIKDNDSNSKHFNTEEEQQAYYKYYNDWL